MVQHHLQASCADHHNDADLTDGCTLIIRHTSHACCLLNLSCEFVRYLLKHLGSVLNCASVIDVVFAEALQMFTVVNCSAVYYLYFEEPLRPCSVLPLNLYSNAAVVFSYVSARHATLALNLPIVFVVVGIRDW